MMHILNIQSLVDLKGQCRWKYLLIVVFLVEYLAMQAVTGLGADRKTQENLTKISVHTRNSCKEPSQKVSSKLINPLRLTRKPPKKGCKSDKGSIKLID